MRERACRAGDRRRSFRCHFAWVALFAALITAPQAAQAQLAGSIGIVSSDNFRGESTAGEDPALVLSGDLETPAGFFAGASASIAAGQRSPRITSASQYAGFALRRGETSFELGVIHRDYHDNTDTSYRRHFFEGFVGLAHRGMKLRLYVSPDYLVDSRNSYYVEATAKLAELDDWTLEGRAGLALIPPDPGETGTQDFQDFTLTLSRPMGKFNLALGLTGTNYPVIGSSGAVKPFVALSRAF